MTARVRYHPISRFDAGGLRISTLAACVSLVCIAIPMFLSVAPLHAGSPAVAGQDSRLPVDAEIKIVHHAPSGAASVYWSSIPEARPSLLGYRAVVDDAGPAWPYALPAEDSAPYLRAAADHVTTRLARDGLLKTLTHVLAIIGPANLSRGEAEDLAVLRQVGMPVDLLRYFPIPGAGPDDDYTIVRYVLGLLMSRRTADQIGDEVQNLPFQFYKGEQRFRAATESGEGEIALFRLQLARGDYWRGVGDGSSLDIARQLSSAVPDARFVVSIEKDQLKLMLGFARLWPLKRLDQLTVIAEPFDVSEWAQDNGKPGLYQSTDESAPEPATIVPRFASRGEEGSIFAPGESHLWGGLKASGHTIVQSPLLFQGGNLMLVADPQMGWRYLLIGEAEVFRNFALGLTADQVIDAFKVEFDADAVVVLPAVSYHIDYELSVRARKDGLTAFVNDTGAAVRTILRISTKALYAAKVLSDEQFAQCIAHLEAGRLSGFLAIARPRLNAAAVRMGQYPEALCDYFSAGTVDSGVGNFQTFLLAMDLAEAESRPAGNSTGDAQFDEYLSAIRRRDAARRALLKKLEDVRFKIVPIPSLAEENRGLNHINGIQTAVSFLMPGSGGFFEEYDQIAVERLTQELGPEVKVETILCGESQRRFGAIHCAVSAYSTARTSVVRNSTR
ncbi:MAG: hypothetical protein IT419_05750 [Planctomycetes bacterium]|nr:hypothetical protein [Planctomycetota bacterium]